MRLNLGLIGKLMAPALLAGCMGSGDGVEALRQAPPDFGRPVAQSDCQSLARRHIDPYLRDASSARYRFSKCAPKTLGANPMQGLPKQSGYAITAKVDSKNGFGFYTGERTYVLLINDGKVTRRMRQTQRSASMERY